MKIEDSRAGEDLAELRRTLEALRASEGKFRTIHDDAPFGIFQSTIEGRLLSVNPTAAVLFGYDSPEEFISSVTDIPKQIFARPGQRSDIIREALQTDRFVRHDVEYRRQDGSTFIGSLYMRVVRGDQGDPAYLEGFVEDITDRKQLEEKLQRQTHLLLESQRIAKMGSWSFDVASGEVRWTGETFRLDGVSQEAVAPTVESFFSLVHPDDRGAMEEWKRMFLAGENPGDREFRVPLPDGRVRMLIARGQVERDFLGKPVRIAGIVQDITRRKLLEQTLQERHEAVRRERDFSAALIDSLPGVLYLYDDSFQFLRWNKNFERVTGYTAEELPRMSPLDFFTGPDRELVSARIQEVFATGASHVEAELVARDGSRTPYFFTGLRAEIDGRTCLLGVGIDISARTRAEKMLHESERKYRELVENANSIILRWGRDGTITFMNEFGQKFFDYPEDEILGRHVVGSIVPEEESTGRDLVQMMEQIRADPQAFEQNVNENMRRNGERVWIAWSNKPVLDDDGHVLEVFSVGTDITERRRAERELEKYREHLEELVEERTDELRKSQRELLKLVGDLNDKTAELEVANEKLKEVDRLKSMFIASMSHELRTPLNSVIGYSSIILNEWLGPVSPPQKEKLAIVLRSGKHLLSLINDVIDVSKIEAGQIEVHFEEFDLFDVTAEAVQQLEPDIRGKGLAFTVDNLHLQLRSDRRRLLQAMLNILSNAMKYTLQGSIRLSARQDEGWAEIEVADTGIGISDKDAANIFHPFVRLESSIRSTVPGTGLGLYLTHKLTTEILHGTISFTSRVGEGSTFTIRLPANLPVSPEGNS